MQIQCRSFCCSLSEGSTKLKHCTYLVISADKKLIFRGFWPVSAIAVIRIESFKSYRMSRMWSSGSCNTSILLSFSRSSRLSRCSRLSRDIDDWWYDDNDFFIIFF